MQPIISISHLSKTYASGFEALKDINLDIRKGEIFALLGPNGAGKSTLINIICGIVTPSAGKVVVDGHDIVTDFRAARAMIGLVPQELTLDMFEIGRDHGEIEPRSVRQMGRSGLYRQDPEGSFASRSQELEADDAVGRHETASADRQGAFARADCAVSR